MVIMAESAPPNSLVLIMGSEKGDIPEGFGDKLIVASRNCVAVGCQSEDDGKTRFWLGSHDDVDPGYKSLFDGVVDTPNGKLLVSTILGDVLMHVDTPTDKTSVSVWVNHPEEPDEIRIGIL